MRENVESRGYYKLSMLHTEHMLANTKLPTQAGSGIGSNHER